MGADITPAEIKRIRGKYGLSQQAFARLLGIGEASMVRYENGQPPSKANANLIRAADHTDFMLECLERDGDSIPPAQRERVTKVVYAMVTFDGEGEIMDINEMCMLTLEQEILNDQSSQGARQGVPEERHRRERRRVPVAPSPVRRAGRALRPRGGGSHGRMGGADGGGAGRPLSSMRCNLVVEGTLRTAELLRGKGYRVSLALMAVKPEISLVSCQLRYELMRLAGTTPRATDPAHHNGIVADIARNVGALEESGSFDEIRLYSRDKELLFPVGDEARTAAEALRAVLFGPWSPAERAHHAFLREKLATLREGSSGGVRR